MSNHIIDVGIKIIEKNNDFYIDVIRTDSNFFKIRIIEEDVEFAYLSLSLINKYLGIKIKSIIDEGFSSTYEIFIIPSKLKIDKVDYLQRKIKNVYINNLIISNREERYKYIHEAPINLIINFYLDDDESIVMLDKFFNQLPKDIMDEYSAAIFVKHLARIED